MMIIAAALLAGCGKQASVLVTAHRGFSGVAPENTLASFKKAIEAGADFAELDVQETADGRLIVLHDGSLKRTGGVDWNIWETPYDSLQKVEVGSWKAPEYKGEPVPLFKDVLETVKGKIRLNIELKMNGHQKQLTEKVVDMLHQENFVPNCIVTSFDFDAIRKVKQLDKNIRAGFIFSKMPDEDVFAADVDLLSVKNNLVDAAFVKKAHDNNKEVHVWTVNEPEDMRRLIALGVDGIITNRPDVLIKVLKGA